MAPAAAAPDKQLAPLLTAGLDADALARITGRSLRTAERWATGESAPRGEARERLLATEAVIEALGAAFPGADAGDWLRRPEIELDFETPIEVIAAGEAKRVLALLTAIGEGAYL